ncbi:hypothetical protein SARC_15593, partial [Sphaeroforma arctica JP610]
IPGTDIHIRFTGAQSFHEQINGLQQTKKHDLHTQPQPQPQVQARTQDQLLKDGSQSQVQVQVQVQPQLVPLLLFTAVSTGVDRQIHLDTPGIAKHLLPLGEDVMTFVRSSVRSINLLVK